MSTAISSSKARHRAIGRLAPIALQATERRAEHALAACGSRDPGAADPGRRVTHVLMVAAFELGHPVLLVVAMVPGDSALHAWTSEAQAADYHCRRRPGAPPPRMAC